ncbi:MAG: RNA-binding protein [Clostridia bacterium]|jgi:ribosomal protein L14E/L6E/L27E|nr:RNA-binding protein [Clostridia bacterium]MBT7122368.1 RNA-binding protein [Clostridia bacterium]
MVSYPVQVGRIAVSKAGRDTGRVFVIKQVIDTYYVYIVDGDLRKMDRPKKKKLKHLKLSENVLDSIADKLKEGTKVFDAEIRSAIRSLQSGSDV